MPQAINTDAPDTARVDPSGIGFSAVAYSPVNDYLATGSQTGQVVLWDEASGKQVLTMEGNSPVTALRWSPQGNRLASLHNDGRLIVWDVSQYSTPGPPVPAAPTTPTPTPPSEGVAQTAPTPATPAAEDGETFQKALAAVDDAVDKLYKDKNATAARWQQVVAQLALVEQQAQSEPDQDAVKRMRRRLTNIADDRVEAAVRQRRNISLYYKFLTEAIAIDPQGPAGKKAQQMLNGGRRPGF
jgi:hypothetical protein